MAVAIGREVKVRTNLVRAYYSSGLQGPIINSLVREGGERQGTLFLTAASAAQLACPSDLTDRPIQRGQL
jgi:hypothetical protein